MSGASPGPWKVDRKVFGSRDGGFACWQVLDSTGSRVAYAEGVGPANARLIAASPEMRDLLTHLSDPEKHDKPYCYCQNRALALLVTLTKGDRT